MRDDGDAMTSEGPEEAARARDGLSVGQAVLVAVVLIAVVVALKALAEAVLPDPAGGIVSAVLTGLGVVMSVGVLSLVRGRRARPEPRPVPEETPAVPRPPRIATGAVLTFVVCGAFVVGGVFFWLVATFSWPLDMAFGSDDRWVATLVLLPGVALFAREIVLELRELPRSRAVTADVLAGRAAHHGGTVARRSVGGLVVSLPEGEERAEVTLSQSVVRRRSWDPLPGDELLLQGDPRKRGLVLVTTADGSRWRRVESVERGVSSPPPAPRPG